jgi:hypothetical protein
MLLAAGTWLATTASCRPQWRVLANPAIPIPAFAAWAVSHNGQRLGRRIALLRGHGRVQPYEPHRVGLVEFGDGFS